MKESEKIIEECNEIVRELNECLTKAGWKGRYLNYCRKFSNRYSECRMKLVEQQRLENLQTSRRRRQ